MHPTELFLHISDFYPPIRVNFEEVGLRPTIWIRLNGGALSALLIENINQSVALNLLVGVTPRLFLSGELDVRGHAYKDQGGTSWEILSDRRLKQDVLEHELEPFSLMKRNLLLLFVAAIAGLLALQQPVGATAFTYQGQLRDADQPASGSFDVRAILFTTDVGGSQVGPIVTLPAVAVVNGIFTTELDFGPGAFNGEPRWVELAVRRTGAPGFTRLDPRQPITPAPFAQFALTPAGPKGNRGENGATGPQGPQGVQGLSGAKGDTGLTGATGQQGPPGSADAWGRTGTGGTTAGVNFLGTSDNQPLEVKVNNARVLRLEPNATSPNVIGGWSGNVVSPGVFGATIGGGGAGIFADLGSSNVVSDHFGVVAGGAYNQAGNANDDRNDANFATVGGGFRNAAIGVAATIGGGNQNTASGFYATVGGGYENLASGDATVGGGYRNTAGGPFSTVGGGEKNTASAENATVGGGVMNTASGYGATVPGGYQNAAKGGASTAIGMKAQANHDYSFVWSGRAITDLPVSSYAVGRFHIHGWNGLSVHYGQQGADGGSKQWIVIGATEGGQAISTWTGAWLSDGGQWINKSDRNSKDGFADVNTREILDKVAALPIQTWRYTNETAEVRHLGPVAQDFKAAFGLGTGDKSIGTVDADGVALAAIQGLNLKLEQELKAKEARIAELERKASRLADLESRLAALERLATRPETARVALPNR